MGKYAKSEVRRLKAVEFGEPRCFHNATFHVRSYGRRTNARLRFCYDQCRITSQSTTMGNNWRWAGDIHFIKEDVKPEIEKSNPSVFDTGGN